MRRTVAGVALAAMLLAGGANAQDEQQKKSSGGIFGSVAGFVSGGKKAEDESARKDEKAEAPRAKSAGGLFSAMAGASAKKPDDTDGEKAATPPPPPPPLARAVARALLPGQEIVATLQGAPTSSNGFLYHCYRLQTGRGSQWAIDVEQKKKDGKYLPAFVRAGDECLKATPLNASRTTSYVDLGYFGGTGYKSTTSFASGGGAYFIIVSAKPADGFGEYKIVARRTGADGSAAYNLLPSGAEVRFGKTDGSKTASTVEPSGKKYATGDVIKDCPDCPQMVVLPAGNFIMGTSASEEDRGGDEGPAHRVTFAHPFAMGVTEVSFAEWDACVADGGCARVKDNWGRGKRPVANVTWADANSYAAWLSKTTGERYFIPSEAEWEYGARAGTKTPWNTGSGIVSDDANIMNAFKQTVPAGGFPANAWGLKDMHGNVWEWTLDCYEVGYFGVPADGGAGTTPNCPNRVYRGGAYDSEPKYTRSAQRVGAPVATAAPSVGFRVARAL